jgi:hypothetical protein
MAGNTKTQRHKGTKKGRNPKNLDAAFLCASVFVFLAECVFVID